MSPRGRFTVRGRTTAVAALVVAIGLVVGAAGLIVLLRTRVIAAERSAAMLRAADVAALAKGGQLPHRLSYPGEDEGLTQVVDSQRRVISYTANLSGERPISSLRPDVGSTVSEIVDRLPIGDGSRFVVVATTVATSGGPVTVYSSASLEQADKTIHTVMAALVLGLPLLVGLVAVVTRVVVTRALRPVERIRAEVAEVTETDLHRRVVTPGTGDEIDRLAGTMNQMLERLESANERQARFVADASHELRSPLAAIRTALEVAVAHPSRVDPQAAMTGALVDQRRIEALVDDLLLLARVAPDAATAVGPVDLALVIGDEVAAFDDPRIAVEVATRELVIIGDQRAMSRVVRNLVDNARRHAVSQVLVTGKVVGESVVVTVEDDGDGVAPADRTRVFERFTRLDDARSRAEGGSGLGLAIVDEAVRDQGGTVVIFEPPLGGAGFSVTLPIRRP